MVRFVFFVDLRLGPNWINLEFASDQRRVAKKVIFSCFFLNTKKATRSRRVESLFFQDIFWGCSTSTSCRYWEISSSFFNSWPFLILQIGGHRKSEMEKMGVKKKGDDLKNLETVISTCSFHWLGRPDRSHRTCKLARSKATLASDGNWR